MRPLITILILGLCCGVCSSVFGQKVSAKQRKEVQSEFETEVKLDCTLSLDRGRALFEKGLLEKIPILLSECARNKNLSSATRQAIIKLLAETHLFLDQESIAADYFEMLLAVDPFYQPQVKIDHPELVHLSKQFKTFSAFSFGVKGGFGRTMVNDQKQFIYEDTVVTQQDKYISKWKALGGAFCTYRPRGRRLEFTLEALLFRVSYDYFGTMTTRLSGETGSLSFTEKQNIWQLPFSVKYLAGRSNIRPYFYAGAAIQFTRRARLEDLELSIQQNGSISQERLTGLSLSASGNSQLRKPFNYTVLAGVGVQYQIERFYFFLDLRYNRMLTNIVKTENRTNNTQLTRDFWHVDNDISLDRFSISFGAAFSIFRSVRVQ